MNEAVERVRKVRRLPQRFGVVDERLVSDGYLRRLPAEAVSLYVFLCVVANREGRSWYSDGRIVQRVRLSSLAGARRQLVEAGLIAWERPVYTLLEVPDAQQQGCAEEPAVQQEQAAESLQGYASSGEVSEIVSAFRGRMNWG